MKKHIKHEANENSERWLLSYADFITLLMVFFIIMYSISAVNVSKFQSLAQSLNEAMAGGGSGQSSGEASSLLDAISDPETLQPPPADEPVDDTLEEAALEAVFKQILESLQENGLENSVGLNIDERGLIISLNAMITFESGSAEIQPALVPQLITIADILNGVDNYVRIEGHTDNVPVGSARYESNWELSTARATSLVELFIHNSDIAPDKLSAVGYGEYRPVASNDTYEGRTQNRRVDVVVIRTKFNELESSSGVNANPMQ
jgi:chemotaxis protein MotB